MANRYWVGGSGTWDAINILNWSLISGGVGGATVPGIADTALFDANSGAAVVTLGANASVLILNATAFSGTLAFSTFKISVAGNAATIVRGSTTLTCTGTRKLELTYAGAVGTRTLALGAVTENSAFSIYVVAGTDIVAIASSNHLYTLDFTGFSGTFTSSSRTIYGGLVFSAGMTISAYGTLTFAATSGPQIIDLGGKTNDGNVTFNGVGGVWECASAFTLGATRTLTFTNGTIKLKNGVTSTVGSFVTSGTNQKFMQSMLAGSQATLSKASGTVSVGYLTIKDINATGGATFNAFTVNSNVNAGNNLGWDFFAQLGKTIYTRRKEKRVLI